MLALIGDAEKLVTIVVIALIRLNISDDINYFGNCDSTEYIDPSCFPTEWIEIQETGEEEQEDDKEESIQIEI